MRAIKSRGLLSGLLVSLVTVLLVAGAAGISPARSVRANGGTAETPSILEAAATASVGPATSLAEATPTRTAPPQTQTTRSVDGSPGTAAVEQEPASSASPVPSPTSSTSEPSATAAIAGTPEASGGLVIGASVEGRPIEAFRVGDGRLKVVLVGDIHGDYEANTYLLAEQLLAHFQTHPQEVPPGVSLWIIPTMNPDGLATGHRWNANDVDLNRNADTDLDGCGSNDWSPDTVGWEGTFPGAGGGYPFSEPETRAMRDFLTDAWVAVFYHSAAEAIYVDTCQLHAPTAKLAEVLSAATGYPVPAGGWSGYRITGDFGDYLAGEGVASVTVELTDHEDPEFERNLDGVRSLLSTVDDIVGAEAALAGAQNIWLEDGNTGEWRYPESSFLHPLALEVIADTAYLLDGGRIVAADLAGAGPLVELLAPGDEVEGTRVLEPLDLAVLDDSLLALDRAGDVYRYDPVSDEWTLERYGRTGGSSGDHYYVSIAAWGGTAYLLETTHEEVWRFSGGQQGTAWLKLAVRRDVGLSVSGVGVYSLSRHLVRPQGELVLYQEGRRVSGFQTDITLMHPRQAVATESVVYVLDRAGRRLLAVDTERGALRALYQFPDRRAVSAVWADPAGDRLILAGTDVLYFYGQPGLKAELQSGPTLIPPQPHELGGLESLRGLLMPIEGASITSRDFQLPGAPRHYRLGVHEGIDFYTHTVGVPVDRSTPVRAVAAGTVVRAAADYEPLTEGQAAAWASQWRRLGYTPPEVLDGYRGMQVWIAHEEGLVSRYAHLGSIASGVVEGAWVQRGQVIATVGNSGTPASITSDTVEVHLHLELWVGDHYVGQFLRPIETRFWLERILR